MFFKLKPCLYCVYRPVRFGFECVAPSAYAFREQIIDIAGKDGAFVLMPGCDIPPNIPYENITKFIQTAKEWRL